MDILIEVARYYSKTVGHLRSRPAQVPVVAFTVIFGSLLTSGTVLDGAFVDAKEETHRARSEWQNGLLFYASFDETLNADRSGGDGTFFTAESLKRESLRAGGHSDAFQLMSDKGKHGGMLRFVKKAAPVAIFKGAGNMPATDKPFSGTVSFWLRLSPAEDLPPGYVDPIQITDKTWNNASFFIDFTQENPRQVRLGAFSDLDFWKPEGVDVNDVPDESRPLVPVEDLPFDRGQWTHVCFTFENFNAGEQESGTATFYLDGVKQGTIDGPQQFSWEADKVVIMLGINYVGDFDELAIWNRAFNADQVKRLGQLPSGLKAELPRD